MPDGSPAAVREGAHTALGHLKVLDMAGPEAQGLGRLLADLGADVVLIEPPGGSPGRRHSPRAAPDQDVSLHFLNYNTNKRSLVLDLESGTGCSELRALLREADVLIESFQPGYLDGIGLDIRRIGRINPRLVVTSITPFGSSGPHRGFLGGELVVQAMGGLMFMQGDPDMPPCSVPAEHSYQLACHHAAYATLAALAERRRSGRGQHIDVSVQEVVAHLLFNISRYALTGDIASRTSNDLAIAPNNYYPCQDGRVCLCVFYDRHWDVLVEWMGDDALSDPAFREAAFRRANPDIVDQFVAPFVERFKAQEMLDECERHHLAASPFNTLRDLAEGPHANERGFFVESDRSGIGAFRMPGAPYRFSRTPWSVRRPAPQPDDARIEGPSCGWARSDRGASPPPRPRRAAMPLEGVRVVDFTRVWAGPLSSRYLAELGAQVVKIEHRDYVDLGRQRGLASGPMFSELNRSKECITVNFRDPDGADLVRELVAVSDVVVDNFAAGVLRRRGLGYEELRQVKPDVIVLSMPGYGFTGPYSRYVAYGQNLMSYSGLSYLWGHPESPFDSRPKIHYTDFVSGASAATAIMAALEYRGETGQGQFIEMDQSEALAATLGVPLLHYFINGEAWEPSGNLSLNAAPHGCYPCRGEDEWCVIECWDESQWTALCEAIGDSDLAGDPRFATIDARLENRAALNERVAKFTRGRTPYQVMRALQRAGVPAGVVQSSERMYYDIHMRSRGFIEKIDHDNLGPMEHPGLPVKLSATPGRVLHGMNVMASANERIFGDLLGNSPERVQELARAGAL